MTRPADPTPPLAAGRLRPLQALPPCRLAALRGVLTDIDDTLTRDGVIEPVALAALHRLAHAGVPVIAITGRPAGWSEPLVGAWPVAAIVAENGGVLLTRDAASPGAVCRRFTVGDAERATRFARLQACARAVLAEVPGAALAQDSPGRLTDIAIDHSEFAALAAPQIDAVAAVMRRHGLAATVSSIHINGWIGEHNKWTGASWAVETVLGHQFDAGEWVYVGDSTNDQLMFERVPLSVGVANVARFLPVMAWPPAWVTVAERGLGFSEVVARLLSVRSGR